MLRTRFAASSVCARRFAAVPCTAASLCRVSAFNTNTNSVVAANAAAVVSAAARTFMTVTPVCMAVAGPDAKKREGAFLLDKVDVLARVTEVVKNFEKVDASKVTAESHFINDLGLDSLDVVEIVMALEQEFVLDIPDHEAEKIQSIPDAVDYLCTNPMAK